MEEKNKLFIDSNFFISLFNPFDVLHQRAQQTVTLIEKNKFRVFISNFIFLETVTVLSQRAGKKISLIAGEKFQDKEYCFIIHIDEPLQRISWKIFQNIKNKNVSFVDCSILAVMQFYNIKKLLTFDKQDFAPLRRKYRFSFI